MEPACRRPTKFKELVLLKRKSLELFNLEYCYDCKQLSTNKAIKFIVVKYLKEGFPLKLMMSIVSCLNT